MVPLIWICKKSLLVGPQRQRRNLSMRYERSKNCFRRTVAYTLEKISLRLIASYVRLLSFSGRLLARDRNSVKEGK